MAQIDLHPSVSPLQPGQLLARGVARHLVSHGFACVEELVPTRGLRVDVMALGPKGEIWVVECKSSRADFTSDAKWQSYLEWADRFFWAVDQDFPTELLPDETGLIIADGYGGEIIRMGPETSVSDITSHLLLKYALKQQIRQYEKRKRCYQTWRKRVLSLSILGVVPVDT